MKTLSAFLLLLTMTATAADLESRVTHGYANSNGVKIHYASLGSGPLEIGRASCRERV